MSYSEAMAELAPIIIKKIKKGGHGHHGGAWKVAYADFVTAMMAFFLLMWLLNATSPDQKKGIADYFTPTVGLKDGKGIGVRGGRSPMSKGTAKNDLHAPGLVAGQVQQGPVAKEPDDAKHPDPTAENSATGSRDSKADKDKKAADDKKTEGEDSEQFKLVGEQTKQAMSEDPEMKEFNNNIQVTDAPEGMKIDIIDDEKKPMFVAGGATLTEGGKKVIDAMVSIIVKMPNGIAIEGHTDAASPLTNAKYTNWELSADRANAARRALVATQLEPERVMKVVGLADTQLLVKDEPANPRNRRVSIVMLRGVYFQSKKNNDKSLVSLPDAKLKEAEVPTPPPDGNTATPTDKK